MSEIFLDDEKWHPCEITGRSEALDYDGYRYNILIQTDTIVTPEGKHTYTITGGTVLFECHSECVRINP